jgi:hypothetical protein
MEKLSTVKVQNMWRKIDFIVATIRKNLFQWLAISFCFTTIYYMVLMLSLVFRFGSLPNYINDFNWIDNIQTIIRSTPSMLDTLMIINNEWVLEIGFMNYDFGMGISEWSLFLAPVKILGVFVLGTLIATNYLLLRPKYRICTDACARSSGAASGFGAICVALASITMSWVVCCSTPTWVVGLAMMGLGVSTSLWLEPMGFWVNLLGFGVLVVASFTAAGRGYSSSVAVN